MDMQEDKDKWEGWAVGGIRVAWRELVITLKRAFNTAHSSSSERHNFLVRIEADGVEVRGFGECGLPPKKPHCYLADVKDCRDFMGELGNAVKASQSPVDIDLVAKSVFENLPENYFRFCRPSAMSGSPH
jgi:hypothetical protein